MKFLDATTDLTFKKIFGDKNKKDIIIAFLNDILDRKEGEKITNVTILDPYNHSEILGAKSSILDIRCVDQKKCTYLVEMQVINQPGFLERCQYYTSLEVFRQLDKGDLYQKLTPVIFIGVVNFIMFDHDRYLSHHLLLDTLTHENDLKPTQYHFLELDKFDKSIDQLSSVIDQWAYFLKNAGKLDEIPVELKKNDEIIRAFEVLEKTKFNRKELEEYDREVDNYRLEKARLQGAEEEGIKIGLKKAAQGMLLNGIDIKEISKMTGLSTDEILALKQSKSGKN